MLNKININPGKQRLIVYIVLTVITLAVYGQVSHYGFANFDDNLYVTHNTYIQSGITLEGIRWAFGTTYLDGWHPPIWLSFMLDYQLYGLDAGGFHLTNLILHIMSALGLFWLFNRMTGAIGKSAFVAAFFALHPLHVESVAWIAERKDVMSMFLGMLTLCLYVYYTEKPAVKRYLLVILGFALALISKPMVVTLPVIMILLDYWPLKRFESRKDNPVLWQLKEKAPFFILSAVFSIMTVYAHHNKTSGHIPFVSRFSNAVVSFAAYLEKTFMPDNMAAFYPFPAQIPPWQIAGASLLIIAVTIFVLITAKRFPYLFAGWFWYAVSIAPVIGIIQISASVPYAMADRYHYLPSIGISIMLAWGIPLLIKSENIRKKILFPAAVSFLILLSVIAWRQCGYWKNDIKLWDHALRVTKNNFFAHKSRGITYGELGQYERALRDLNQAVFLKPDYADSYNARGNVYFKLGQNQQAIENYNEAILLKPDYTMAYFNRGIAYITQGNKNLACPDAQKACELGDCKLLEMAKHEGDCP